MKKFFLKNTVTTLLTLVAFLLILNTCLIVFNKSEMVRNTKLKAEAEAVSNATRSLLNDIFHNIDLGVRAFGVVQKESLLDPTNDGFKKIEPAFENLKKQLGSQNYGNMKDVEDLHKAFVEYMDFSKQMIEEARRDSSSTFKKMLEEDKGLALYLLYKDVSKKIIDFETIKNKQAVLDYESAQNRNLILQFILVLFSLPTFGYIIFKLRKDGQERTSLLFNLEENNRRYIFDSGTKTTSQTAKEAIENSIKSFKDASLFIKKLAEGEYDTQWEGLNEENKSLNQETLVGELIKMKEGLKSMKENDEKRLWANEGLSKFSEIVRNNQHDMNILSNECIRFLAQYLNIQQAGLFVLENEETEPCLTLTACYAFGRKKYLEKKIEIGAGLVGQTFLEKETTLLTDVPNGYTTITSGLGDATPSFLLLVPLKYNEKVEGVIELAGFTIFADYQINFVEKAGEFIASAMLSVKTTGKMRHLLAESQQQSEEMRAAEEEMRQNMEEMQATQEEVQRKSAEVQSRIQAIDESGIASIEFDTRGNIVNANQSFLNLMGYSLDEIVGKHHRIFVNNTYAKSEAYDTFWQNLASGFAQQGEFERIKKNGEKVILFGSYSAIRNGEGRVERIIKLATDITESKNQVELLQEQEAMMRQNVEEMQATQEEVNRLFKDTQEKERFVNEIINSSSDSILTVDKNYQIIFCNEILKASYRPFGVEVDKGFPVLSLIAPEQVDIYKDYYDRAFLGERFEVTNSFLLNEKEMFFTTLYNPLRNSEGEVIGVTAFGKDVTNVVSAQQETERLLAETKAQEEELRQNMEELAATQEEVVRKQQEALELLERFELASATTTEGLWDMTVPDNLEFNDYTPFSWTQNFRKMLGYKDETDFPNILSSWSNLLHPEHKEKTINAFTAHLVDFSGQTPYDVQYQLQLKNGKYKWFRAVGSTLRDETGKPLRVAGSLIDIEQNIELNGILSALNQFAPFVEYNPEGKIINANSKFLQILGYELDAIQEKPHTILLESAFAKSKQYQNLWSEVRKGNLQKEKVTFVTKDNKPFNTYVSYIPSFDNAKQVIKIFSFIQESESSKK